VQTTLCKSKTNSYYIITTHLEDYKNDVAMPTNTQYWPKQQYYRYGKVVTATTVPPGAKTALLVMPDYEIATAKAQHHAYTFQQARLVFPFS
jgi:hypothetical protein